MDTLGGSGWIITSQLKYSGTTQKGWFDLMNRCAGCGFPIRAGEQLCPVCSGTSPPPDAFLEDGTPLYLKTSNFPAGANLQMQLYEMLANSSKKRKE